MLDDLGMIHRRDSQDLLGEAERLSQQLTSQFVVAPSSRPVDNVVFVGMGGSAISALIARMWLDISVPVEIVRDYDVPGYVGPRTLCIAASYSGDTEETVSAFMQAQAKGAQMAVITGGGTLQSMAAGSDVVYVRVPPVGQPRFAQWLTVKALTAIFEAYGLMRNATSGLEAQRGWLLECIARWRPDVSTAKNEAKQIALELAGKSVVIQSGSKLWPAAYSWKAAVNENAKQVAWASCYPELNHNEYLGWTRQPTYKPYAIIELRSSLEHPQTQKRFEVSERLLSGLRPAPIIVHVQGETLLQQLLYATALGNFVSIYLALLSGIDPSSAQAVSKLKKEL